MNARFLSCHECGQVGGGHMETEEDVIEFVGLAHGVKLWNEEGGV